MFWLYYLPTWLLGLLVILAYGGFALLGSWLVDKRLHSHGSNNLVSDTIRSVVACYSILLGLTAVTTWDNFKQVQANVVREAHAAADMYRHVDAYPEADRERIHALLRTYVRTVLHEEWPAQQNGQWVAGAAGVVDRLLREQHQVKLETSAQRLAQDAAQERLEEMVQARRHRRAAISSGLHPMMWFVVLVGGLIAITLNFFYYTEHRRLKHALTTTLAGMIGLVVFWIFALDHPLWGEISVPPDKFATVLYDVMGDAAIRPAHRH